MVSRAFAPLLVSLLSACGTQHKPEPFPYRDEAAVPSGAEPSGPAAESESVLASVPGAASGESTAPAPEAPLSSLRDAPPLPAEVDAGPIARPELMAVLQQGIPRFLQQVHTEPLLNGQGRFVGWRLLELYAHDARMSRSVIRPGDVVMRVNGHSIERPEQFQNVWNSVGTSSELVLLVLRGDQTSEIRYRIE